MRSSITTLSISSVYSSLSTDKTEEVRRLGMGRLLSDLSRKMHSRVVGGEDEKDREKAPKILVHSTHDTALAALCNTLDVFDDKLGILSRLLWSIGWQKTQMACFHGIYYLWAFL